MIWYMRQRLPGSCKLCGAPCSLDYDVCRDCAHDLRDAAGPSLDDYADLDDMASDR